MKFPLERYLNVRSANQPTFAPDGRRIAFVTNVTGIPQLWEVDREGGWPDQLTFFSERVDAPVYAPGKRELAFHLDRGGDERFQIWRLAEGGATVEALTEALETVHYVGDWSRDSRRLTYSANDRDPRFFDVFVRDMDTGDVRRIYRADESNLARMFTPDGRLVLITVFHGPSDQDLYLVDVETGEAHHLTPHEGAARFAESAISGNGRDVYAVTDVGREFLAVVRRSVRRGPWETVWEEPWDVTDLALSHDGRHAAVVVNEGGVFRLKVLRLRDRAVVAQPAVPDGDVGTPTWSPDGRYVAFAFKSPRHPEDVWVLDVRRNEARQVTHSARAGLPPDAFVAPEVVKYPTFDGREVPAWLYPPTKGDRPPVVVWVHGGPESQAVADFNPVIQYFTNRGYSVLVPNVRGSSGYGKTYEHLDDVEKRMDAVADLKHAADWLRTRADVDGSRIAVMGGSYGGFMVLAALTEYPDTWSAGVDVVGIANFVTFLENTGAWRRKWREAEYGSLEKDRAVLERISPIHKADRIQAPLFVIHGKNDPRVPLEETEQIVEAVRKKGGVVDFLVFADEGHGLVRLTNRIRGYTAAADFLDRIFQARTEDT